MKFKVKNKHLVMIALAALASCAKERPFDVVYKGEDLFVKTAGTAPGTAIPCQDKNDPCLYVPSVVETPRNVEASRPYWMGEQKLVTIDIAKDSLRIMEIDADERYRDNAQNKMPVMKIPVEHVDYQCALNDFNECTNREEEVTEKEWHQKRFVKVNFDDFSVVETNMMPIQLENLGYSCYREVGSKIIDRKIENKAINITVERMYEANVNCVDWSDPNFSFSNLAFTEVSHYSMVQLSEIASKDYEPVYYDRDDENTFGFFNTTRKQLSVDNRMTNEFQYDLMNRWNPKRKEIVYYLTDNFYKEENKHVLEMTHLGIETLNNSFKLAGADLKIVLRKAEGRHSGDLRNNMITLVEDPLSAGLLGYGPSVTNPLTGEIVHARNVMYLGTLTKFIKQSYDELLEENRIDPDSGMVMAGDKTEVSKAVQERASHSNKTLDAVQMLTSKMMKDKGMIADVKQGILKNEIAKSGDLLAGRVNRQNVGGIHSHDFHDHISNESIAKVVFDKNRKMKTDILKADKTEMYEILSRNNAYHGDLFNFDGAVSAALSNDRIMSVLGKDGLRPWKKLSKEEKQGIIKAVLPFAWIPTLVHEMGHNLGLRHNFNGSEDKDNFYTKKELEALRVNTNKKITYSSVMDYAYSNWNELPVMGKYDIAALRFGYARKVEVVDEASKKVKLVDVKETKTPMKDTLKKIANQEKGKLKDYMFCTDEHVSVNAGCNRFDEGTTLEEIAKHYVKNYNKSYKKAKHRRDRYHFSLVDDPSRVGSIQYTMRGLRLFFETYDRIKGMYGLSDQQYDQIVAQQKIEFLADIKRAVKVAGDFYLDVLKTPDTLCAAAARSNPSQIIAVVPLKNFTLNGVSCLDEENIQGLPDQYMFVGEAGRHFQSKKDPNADHKLVSYADQIDISGIWMDKILALRALMDRTLGISTFDTFTGSYFDMPEYRQQIAQVVMGLMNDNVSNVIEIVTAAGQKLKTEASFAVADTHIIPGSLLRSINNHFGLKDGNNLFINTFMNEFSKRIYNRERAEETEELYNIFAVYRSMPNDGTTLKEYLFVDTTAGRFLAKKDNVLALNAISLIQVNQILGKLDKKVIEAIIASRAQTVTAAGVEEVLGQVDDGSAGTPVGDDLPATPEVEAAKKLPTEVLQSYLDGEIASQKHLIDVLKAMPTM
jgi:hypothetical protein